MVDRVFYWVGALACSAAIGLLVGWLTNMLLTSIVRQWKLNAAFVEFLFWKRRQSPKPHAARDGEGDDGEERR